MSNSEETSVRLDLQSVSLVGLWAKLGPYLAGATLLLNLPNIIKAWAAAWKWAWGTSAAETKEAADKEEREAARELEIIRLRNSTAEPERKTAEAGTRATEMYGDIEFERLRVDLAKSQLDPEKERVRAAADIAWAKAQTQRDRLEEQILRTEEVVAATGGGRVLRRWRGQFFSEQ